jgi:hypothetical protein
VAISFKVLLAAVLPVLVWFAASSAKPAAAAPPIDSSGTFEVTASEVLDAQEVGNVAIFVVHNTVELTGTTAGTLDCTEVQIVKASGAAKIIDECAFTGTIDGRSGTATILVVGHINPNGAIHGKTTTHSGTGDLAGVSGAGRISGADGAGTYDGFIRFAGS